ncbi:MAG TPA: hypothetical protein VE868_07480 [Balneolaceae bacterium]|nr:hypothetical protein [Balneolaceae bacterium]
MPSSTIYHKLTKSREDIPMKNLNLSFLKATLLLGAIILGATTMPSLAQQKEAMNMSKVPQSVITAIQTDFPSWDLNQSQWYYYPSTDDMSGLADYELIDTTSTIDRYVVSAQGPGYKIKAIYGGNGELRYSKGTYKNWNLPEEIQTKLTSDPRFQGWHHVGNEVVIRDFRNDKKIYKITLANNGNKKTVYFNYLGQVKKIKK